MNTAAIQTAIYKRLTAYNPVSSLVTGVYDARAPQGTAMPYICIDTIATQRDETKTDPGGVALITLHLWDESLSQLALRQIEQRVYECLHRFDMLTVAGCDVIDCLFEQAQNIGDPDGRTAHVVMTFRLRYFVV
jgi:hypothetical protein